MGRVIRKKTTTTTTTPAPTPSTTTTLRPGVDSYNLGKPKGNIPTDLKIAYGRGAPWKDVTRHNPFFIKYGLLYGVEPEDLQAMVAVESGGQSIPNGNGFPNFGIFQLTHSRNGGPKTTWERVGELLRVDFDSPEGQTAITAYVLGGKNGDTGTPREIFLRKFYPVLDDEGNLCLDCEGQDGHTPRQYLEDVDRLKQISYAAAGKNTTPAVTTTPAPAPQGDVIDLLYGGKPYEISADYGQAVTWQCPTGINPGQPGNCYEFQKAYGLDDRHHYAYDVSADAGDGAPLYAPFDALVVCAGTGVGSGAWGTGCAANNRLNNYGGLPARAGAGRLELLNENGTASLIIGHVLGSRVQAGDRVKRGDHIGWQGGMNASHVHLEGRYASGTKIGDPRRLFPGGPMPVIYAERLPIPQPTEFDVAEEVTANRDGVPVLQRAMLDAEPVRHPLAKGETFDAVYTVLGNDGNWYWISSLGSRIPIAGTTSKLLGVR